MSEQEKNNIQCPSWPPADGTGVCRVDQVSPDPQKTGTVSSGHLKEIRNAVRNKYAGVAVSAAGKFLYPTGKDGAVSLKYDSDSIENAPPGLLDSFCGVGNPFSLGKIRQGETVLDLGCGAGFDLFAASRLVGERGRVCGVDLTEQMVERAQHNLSGAHITNAEVRKVDSENIPYADNTFDVVISNGVINLSPSKDICFNEIYRVLKPGGRLQFADVILEAEMPQDLSGSLEAWSQWIGGTVPVGDQISMMKEAGFIEIQYLGTTGFHTSQYTVGALFRARKAWKWGSAQVRKQK